VVVVRDLLKANGLRIGGMPSPPIAAGLSVSDRV
jgi:hypothetical protein